MIRKHFGTAQIAKLALSIVVLMTACGARAAYATSYFISTSGSNSNTGTSPWSPWKDFTNVSTTRFRPGDEILLNGGDTFTGTLTMNSSGNSHNPIVIESYGRGNAIINGGSGDGIDSTNTSYVTVRDLTVYGTGGPTAYNFGVSFVASAGAQSNILVEKVTSYGFGIGVSIESSGGTFTGVKLSEITAYNDNYWGIFVQGYNNNSSPYSNISNVVIEAGNFYGDGSASKGAGSGVLLEAVNGAVVKNSTAYKNGDIGFWCYSSNNIVFTHDTAYGNLSSNGDGGFDLDEGTTNSRIEYSYAHDNAGEGFELCSLSATGQTDANLTVRYNISENDHYPIAFGTSPVGGFASVYIYNNTIYTNRSDGLDYWAAFSMWDTPGSNIVIANNLVWNENASEYDLQWNSGILTLDHNDYYGAFEATFDGITYTSFSDFQSTTGLEKHGFYGINPLFVGTPGTQNPEVYRLDHSSRLLSAGVDLRAAYGVDPGKEDYYGNRLPRDKFSIGAYQGEEIASQW